MASLSLPRVLQQRKTSLELERENFEKSQAVSIGKAMSHHESPVKEKHVRSTIIGTFQEKGAQTFWQVVLKQPLQDDRIVTWKFCHVLHKVLREGHPQVVNHSQRHRGMLQDLGKLWCHLREGYGKLIQHYTQFLITKLDFHRRNPRFPGNLVVTEEELENIGENDINNYFQMSVEMFDYMDDILTLQSSIFGSLDMSRCNSMMSSGQCRLAPLIPCIQDSSRLYDYCVKILFRLHSSLPPDTLVGHRDRFLKQFKILRDFYLNSNNLQYFKNLIQIPLLPDNPPNFLIEAELRTYVAPVVIMPDEHPDHPEPDQMDGMLVDTSENIREMVDLGHRNGTGSVSPDHSLLDRDGLVEQYHTEMASLRNKIQQMVWRHGKEVGELRERMMELETDVATRESELLQERQLKEDLLRHTEETSKYHEYERRAKTMEEKFQKLKDVYTKLREEHIQLLRAKADVDKQAMTARMASEEAARAKDVLSTQLREAEGERQRTVERLQMSAAAEEQVSLLRGDVDQLGMEKLSLTAKIDWLVKEKNELESDLQDLLELQAQKEDLDVRLQDMQKKLRQVEGDSVQRLREQDICFLGACVGEAQETVRRAVEEVDNPALSSCTSTPDYFKTLLDPISTCLRDAKDSSSGAPDCKIMAALCIRLAGHVAPYLVHGKITSHSSPDIELGDRISEACKQVGSEAVVLLGVLGATRSDPVQVQGAVEGMQQRLRTVTELLETMTGAVRSDSGEVLANLVDTELSAMEKAIEEAANRIQEMLKESRKSETGIKLEVHEKILDSCTTLMAAIRVLVQRAKALQAEIVSQGKGTHSATEFYKRNHRWTEGLISAAKAVASGAQFLLTCADKVVGGQGKFEQLIVASQEIAASTAQLVVASRVKADRNSANLANLSSASKGVTSATASVVATAKSCGELVEESEELDVTGLSLHQAKRLEMESQVRVIELDAALQQERVKLSALRRRHYQLAGESEGWEQQSV